jgi:gliding motility-associated-like protein
MKKLYILSKLLLLFPLLLWSQPPNDDCSGLINLGVAPACPDSVFFTNVGATASDIGFGNIPGCFNGGGVQRDVWFAFTSSDTIFDYTITVTGLSDGTTAGMTNPQVALYRGSCAPNALAELACASAELGATEVKLNVVGLTPNITYFLRINDYSATAAPNSGTFQVCVDEIEQSFTIDQDGSTACSGTLYDTGGPNGDYGNNENHTFTICPDQPHECIIFTLEYFFIEPSAGFFGGDQLSFFDGPTANPATLINQIGGSGFVFDSDGGGGVCFQVQATSGCLTVQFISDAFVTYEGFKGDWQCTQNCLDYQPIVVTPNIDETQIIDFVSTPATAASIASINCPTQSYGLFQAGDNSDLGLERGLLLTNGDIFWAVGPNTSAGAGNPNADNGAPGDPDLDYLSGVFGDNTPSTNACVIELDVFVATNELTFEYVFGSEEYPEFVDDIFNDIFAFFISGPGIVGDPNIGNQLNIAVLPDGNNTPVQINSVNNLTNWQYYRNNNNGLSIEYDGMTSDFLGVKKSLTARAGVIPCNTYRLKLAIADRGDEIYDSGVFIAELKGGTPQLFVQFNSGINYLVEDCTNQPDEVIIQLSSAFEDTTSFNVTIGGTATLGVDYLLNIPSVITFLPGQTQLAFPIIPLSDMEEEPIETITITLSNDFGCGNVVYSTIEIELHDALNVQIFAGQDTAFVCQDSSLVLSVTGASSYFWTPVNILSSPTSPNPAASPAESQWVYVEGSVGPCLAYDSIYLQIIDPEIAVIALDPTAICQGDSVQLAVIDNVNGQGLSWSPTAGLSDPASPMPIARPQTTTTYTASVNVAGCVVSDTITIDVSPFEFPQLANDTLICQNYSVQLATPFPGPVTTQYAWSPTAGLDDPSSPAPIATPDETTTYQLIATSANGACADTAEVTITVLPADVDILNPDTTAICLGEVAVLTAVTSTGSADNLLWAPFDGTLSDTLGLSVTVTTSVSNWYYATFFVGDCLVFDSVYVRVDSLPDLSLSADPEKDFYCQGEIVLLTSPTYEPDFHPDIVHLWLPAPGYETGDSLLNMVITTTDTFLYQRITSIGGCRDTAEILLNVVRSPVVTLSPLDPTICAGDAIQFQLQIDGEYEEIEWEGPGLSCTDCLDPIASPAAPGVVQYTATLDADACPVSVGTSVTVLGPPRYLLNTIQTVCVGSAIQLNLDADNLSTYTWTSNDPGFGIVTEARPTVSPTLPTTTYYLLADNGVCPPVQDSLTIMVIPQADVSVATNTPILCAGEQAVLTATVTNSSDDDSYLWRNSANSQILMGPEITVSPTQTTIYFLQFTSGSGCDTLFRELTIEVVPRPVLNLIDDLAICLGESVLLNLAADAISIYTWTADDPAFGTTNEPQPTVTPTQTTTYFLSVENSACPPENYDITVEVINPSNLQIDGPLGLICTGDPITLSATVDGGSMQDSYLWSGSDGSTAEGSTVAFSPTETTVYTLTYTDVANCTTLVAEFRAEVEPGLTVELTTDLDLSLPHGQGTSIVLNATVSTQAMGNLTYTWLLNGVEVASGLGLSSYEDLLLQDPSVYTVIVTTPTGCSDTAAVTLIVPEPIFEVPNAFTPNGDGLNDFFNFVSTGRARSIVDFRVFNRWGQLVFEGRTTEDPDGFEGWDGNYNGKPQPSDIYFFMISLERFDGQTVKLAGDVALLR